MWNAPKNQIPERDIRKEHLRILAEYDLDFPPKQEVFDALIYLENRALRKYGFVVYREGLKGDSAKLKEGLRLIRENV